MGLKKTDLWILPVSKTPEDNVWVVIAESRMKDRNLRKIRVFTTEPTDAFVEHFRRALGDDATAIVIETAPDHFDADEIDTVAC
jgi:hypothetical protein